MSKENWSKENGRENTCVIEKEIRKKFLTTFLDVFSDLEILFWPLE